ncbi:MAG: rod-binding protein [Gemmatimonadaceae bacterium]
MKIPSNFASVLPTKFTAITSSARSVSLAASSTTTETSTAAASNDDDKLRKASNDLEGLFVSQLFKAMRETVPKDDGIVSGGSGEEIFTGLMDEHLAAETPKHWGGGISEALYRQLRKGLSAVGESGVPSSSSTVTDVSTSSPSGR